MLLQRHPLWLKILTEISLWLKMILTERVNNSSRVPLNIFLFTKPLHASAETPSLWLKMLLTERVSLQKQWEVLCIFCWSCPPVLNLTLSVNIIYSQRDISVIIICSQRDISVNIISNQREYLFAKRGYFAETECGRVQLNQLERENSSGSENRAVAVQCTSSGTEQWTVDT